MNISQQSRGSAAFTYPCTCEVFSSDFGFIAGGDDPRSDAETMKALDLMISIDSMPAHLAGALGVPTWTLLPTNADWRWLSDRTDSP